MTITRLPKLLVGTGMLASAALASAASEPPQTVQLYGMARDFLKTHPDFNRTPVNGYGHYAGNVGLSLDSSGQPVFLGNGFKVATEWRNAATQPIAPHLYTSSGVPGQIKLAQAPMIQNNVILDTWDSSVGPYGGSNIGPAPTYQIGATMPSITLPAWLGPSTGNVTLNNTTLSSNLHCNNLTINGTVQVSGHRTVRCDGAVTIASGATLSLQPASTLTLFVVGGLTAMPHSSTNVPPSTGLPGLLTIYNTGTTEFKLSQPNCIVYANVISPNANLHVQPNSAFYGSFVGKSLELNPNCAFHVDTAGVVQVVDACGNLINDIAGFPAMTSNGDITSATTFAQWYKDCLGVNVSRYYPITLQRNVSGVYEYLDDAFYLLDGDGFGNEGDAHNYNFTYAIDAEFTYAACGHQFLELTSVDDGWVFINEDMVIDLGGIVPGTEQVIDIDRLHLTDGQDYKVHMFYAHRHGGAAKLHLRTNIELRNDPDAESTVSLIFD